ncbi:MAG: Response regulator receiver protein [uncultured bacterium]|nr:MAG: Response regulator receiver protein [uncultured bacterium]HLD44946.1 response regulator transcription factor [bacterium]
MKKPLNISSIKKTKIFIVDDHPILRQGLTLLINNEEDMIVVGEAENAPEAIKGIEKERPDLAIVDISLEGTSGLELTKNILVKQPKLLVLIISMYDESVYVERVVRAGAKGYVNKREVSEHVISAIRKVLDGKIYVSDQWKDKLVHRFSNKGTATTAPFVDGLSDRELEVLQMTGQGQTTRQIAEELHVSVKTVESHYANIKNKLDLKNSHELIQFAVKWCLSEK